MDSAQTSEAPEVRLHFLDYWRVIRLRKSLILTVFFLCVITSTMLCLVLKPKYASTVQIEVQKDTPIVPLAGEVRQVSSWDPYFVQTQFKIIESFEIVSKVIEQLNLDKKLAAQNDETIWSVDDTYFYLHKKITVEQSRGTSLIEITVKNKDKELAAQIANAIAAEYKKSRLDEWKQNRTSGIDALTNTVNQLETDLQTGEKDLDRLRTELHVPELDDVNPAARSTIQSETMRELERNRISSMVNYEQDYQMLTNLTSLSQDQRRTALATAYGRQVDPELPILAERVSTAEDRLAQTTKDYGIENPKTKGDESSYLKAKKDYDDKIEGIIAGLGSRVSAEKLTLDVISREEKDAEEKANEDMSKYRPYFSKKQDVENLRRDVEDMHIRLNREISEAAQPLQTIAAVRDAARPAKEPYFPNKLIIIPAGIVVGLIVGIALAFFIEYLDTSVKTIDDVERSLQAHVLGVIPQNVGSILDEGPDSPHAEAYRVLRTNILFARKNEQWNSLSVLSGGAGEGKSTTLFNLATVFAQNGQRVLVVDSDLRRPAIHKLLHASNTVGLTNYLLNQNPIEEVIQKTKLPTMDFISSGKLPGSSMSILDSPQMIEAIKEMKRRYDFVFFDSPPLLGVSDASVLASEMDMVLQVVQYRRYPQPMTLRAKQMIQTVGGNLLGIVLNNINMSGDENYYYYSGYYGSKNDSTVVKLSDAAAKEGNAGIKQKY